MNFDELKTQYRQSRAPHSLQRDLEVRFETGQGQHSRTWPALASAGAIALAFVVAWWAPQQRSVDVEFVMAPATLGGMINQYSPRPITADPWLGVRPVTLASAGLPDIGAGTAAAMSIGLSTVPALVLPTLPATPGPTWPNETQILEEIEDEPSINC